MIDARAMTSALHPQCQACGWRTGGVDSWDGKACKCGDSEPAIPASNDAAQTRTKVGVTSEGLPCVVTLHYPVGASEDSPPDRVSGVFQALDGAGAFVIERDGARFRDIDTGRTHLQAHALLPNVVGRGVW